MKKKELKKLTKPQIIKSIDKMKKIVKLSNGRQIIGVDGGVNDKNIRKIYKTGIDVTIIAVTAGDASLVIVSPVENSPVVVRAPEL